MFVEFYLYGLLLGFSVCSACAMPVLLLSDGRKKALAYIFGSRFLLLLIPLPLLHLLPYLQIAGSIVMLSVGIYAFVQALEGDSFRCTRGVIAATFICFIEGTPAVLLADSYLAGFLNAFLFTAGTVTPLLLVSAAKIKVGSRLRLVMAGFVIVMAVIYLYKSLFVLGAVLSKGILP